MRRIRSPTTTRSGRGWMDRTFERYPRLPAPMPPPLTAISRTRPTLMMVIYFLLSVACTHRTLQFLDSSSALQTVERCERWAQECIISRRRSWWQRGVSSTTSSSSSSSISDEYDGCGGCKAAKRFHVCLTYMEEVSLALISPTPAIPTVSTVDAATAPRSRGGILSRLRRPNEGPGGEATRKPRPAVLRAIGGELFRARCKMSAPAKHVLSFGGKVARVIRRAMDGRVPIIGRKGGKNIAGAEGERGGCRDSDGADGRSRRKNKLVELYPTLIHIPHQHTKRSAAQRALGGPRLGTVPLAVGLNVFVFGMVGIGVYAAKNRRRSGLRQERAGCEAAAPHARHDTGGADSAVSRAPAPGASRHRHRRAAVREPCRSWEDWDDASFKEFLLEEARTFDDSSERRRQLQEFDEDAMLPELARQWKVPFVSKEEFLQQKEAACKLEHVIGDDGRLVPRSQYKGVAGAGCSRTGTGTRAGGTEVEGEGGRGDDEYKEDEGDDELPPWLKPEARWAVPSWMESRRSRVPHTYTQVGSGGGGSGAAVTESDVVPEMSTHIFPPPRLRRVSSGGGRGCDREVRGDSRGVAGTGGRGGRIDGREKEQQRQQVGEGDGAAVGGVECKKAQKETGWQEGAVHRAVVWDWQVGRGEATYAVEVENFGQSEARIVFRRYGHFLKLWREACVSHPSVRDFSFPAKEAAFSAREVFAEVLGNRYLPLEEQLRVKFCELLEILVGLEPRPRTLLDFLAPWPSDNATATATAHAAAAAALVAAAAPVAQAHPDRRQSEQKSGDQPRAVRGRRGRPSKNVSQPQPNAPPPGRCAMGGVSPATNRPPQNCRRSGGGAAAAPPALEARTTAEELLAIPPSRDVRLGISLAYVCTSVACTALWALERMAGALTVVAILVIAPLAAAAVLAVSASCWSTWKEQRPPRGQQQLCRANVDTATNVWMREHIEDPPSSSRPLQDCLFGGGGVAREVVGSGVISSKSPARARTPGGTRRGRPARSLNRRRDNGSRPELEQRTTGARARSIGDARAAADGSGRRCESDRRCKQ